MSAVRTFGGFELHEKIGSGGMATVYRGVQKSLDRPVVLKILHAHLAEDESLVIRFEREARSAANLSHENIVQVIDCGRQDDTSYIAMEFVEGQDLKRILDQFGRPPMDVGLLLLRDVCRGLAHAHANLVIHRDIKPANLMLTVGGMLKIMDFGLARRGEDSVGMTATGAVLGTPAYMSPEQAQGRKVDGRTDVFSTGVVGYEILSGIRPFPGDSYASVIQAILNLNPDPVDRLNPDVPPALSALIARMLEKDPERRCPGIATALEELETLAEGRGLARGAEILRRYYADPAGKGDLHRSRGVSGVLTPEDTRVMGTAKAPASAPTETPSSSLATRVETGADEPSPEPKSRPSVTRSVTGAGPGPRFSIKAISGIGGGALAVLILVFLFAWSPWDSGPKDVADADPGSRTGTSAGATGSDRPKTGGTSTPTGSRDEGTSDGTGEKSGGTAPKTVTGSDGAAVKTGTGSSGTGVKTGGARREDPKPDDSGRAAGRRYQISTKPFGLIYMDGGARPLNPEGRPVQLTLSAGKHTFRVVNQGTGKDVTCTYRASSDDPNNKLIINLNTGIVEASQTPDLPF